LLPPALRLPVVHHQIALTQFSRGAKVKDLTVNPTVEHDCCVAQWAEGYRHGHFSKFVVNDLMVDEYLQWISARLTVHRNDNEWFARIKPRVGGVYPLESRLVNRWDPILRWSSRAELA
jgi:hypothetical protein